MDSHTFLSVPVPRVLLVDLDADEVFHHIGDSCVVVALDPDDLHAALRVRQLAQITDEFPVVAGEAREIQVLKDVAKEYETLETGVFQEMQEVARQGHLGAEMDVAYD